jgi:two-component system, chemotaxis family, chemotaxis protein CheY
MQAASGNPVRFNLRDLSILIVDGNEFALSFTRNIFQGLRCREIVTAKSPVEALGVLKEKSVDVVITEWTLRPLAGGAFIRHIRSLEGIRNPQLPVIVLTASSDLETVAAARDAGANEFLMRPLNLERLLARLTHAMSQPRPFVRAKTYIGPDRRRKERPFDGPDRRNEASVAKPPSRLAKALAERVLRAGGQTIDEMVKIGERVVAEEGERYREVRHRDLKNIIALTKQLKEAAASAAELVQAIHDTSHDLKGMGQTFGYPLLTEAGDSMCKLLADLPPERATASLIIQAVETHAMVMNFIVDKDISEADEIGTELIESLRTVVQKAAGT